MSQILTLIFRKVFKEQHSVLIAKKWYLYHLVNDIYIIFMLCYDTDFCLTLVTGMAQKSSDTGLTQLRSMESNKDTFSFNSRWIKILLRGLSIMLS